MAGMIEAPVVFIEVQRGGPSTGIPTKTEQADLNQVFGASQGDYPRVIIAPTETADCYYTAVEALNLAEKYQLPVTIISDLLLSEHPETIEPDALPPRRADRARRTRRASGPRATARAVQALRLHAVRRLAARAARAPRRDVRGGDRRARRGRRAHQRRVHTRLPCGARCRRSGCGRWTAVLAELPPPQLEGPAEAEVTLIGWGSTWGVIREAVALLAARGVRANHLHFKYLVPVPRPRGERDPPASCRRTICVECNYTGQFARHLRAETGDRRRRPDPASTTASRSSRSRSPRRCAAILEGRPRSTRGHAGRGARDRLPLHPRPPGRQGAAGADRADPDGSGEPVWLVELVGRESGEPAGELRIGRARPASMALRRGWHSMRREPSTHGTAD